MRSFRELIRDRTTKPFMVGVELVTSRSTLESKDGRKVTKLADAATEWEAVDWVSITDNAGGNPMLAPSTLGRRVLDRGKDVIVHLACKDRNRNAIESVAWQYHSEGLHNILALTGDYPVSGYRGIAAPVFDLDACTLLRMLSEMNDGLQVPGRKPGSVIDLPATDFFLGAAVSPFKANEAELMCQYLKMELKVKNGAGFLIPQIGYDMRKSHELTAYLKQRRLDVPVFGNIYRLTKTVAGLFNKRIIPGCYVSDKLLAEIRKAAEAEDKGKSFFLELAARQYACFKGLGYRGAYIGGFTKMDDARKIVELGESFGEDDWKEFAKDLIYPEDRDFYLFAEDPETKLADPDRKSPEILAAADQVDRKEITLMYRLNRFVHKLVFEPTGLLFKPVRKIYEILDRRFPRLMKLAGWQERVIKKAMFDCQDCGDCSLFDCQYNCPGSQCQKNQRNGPCGGSRGPLCESADVPCIWYRAYHRAKKAGQLDTFLRRELILRNHELKGTSSWANYFLGRDHAALGNDRPADAEKRAAQPAPAAPPTEEKPAAAETGNAIKLVDTPAAAKADDDSKPAATTPAADTRQAPSHIHFDDHKTKRKAG